jgi:hypothetical protein
MVDLLVRGLDEETAFWLKSIARSENTSLNEVTRQALEARARRARERRAALWADLAAMRAKVGPVADDSVEIIREFRERAW